MGQAKRRGTLEHRKAEAIRLKKPSYKNAIGEILFKDFYIPGVDDVVYMEKRSRRIVKRQQIRGNFKRK